MTGKGRIGDNGKTIKRFALAVALTGVMSVTALAGNIPDFVSPPPATTTSATSSTSNTLLAQVVLAVITLIGRRRSHDFSNDANHLICQCLMMTIASFWNDGRMRKSLRASNNEN